MLQKLKDWKLRTEIRLMNFLKEERGEVNIVATVVLIGIAVILALVFKDAIKKLLDTLLASITKNATDAATGTY